MPRPYPLTKLPISFLLHALFSAAMLFAIPAFGQKEDLSATEAKYKMALQLIDLYYLDTVSNEKLTEAAIKAMLKELDPHSTYIAKKDVKKTNEPLEGSFEGVGINYQIVRDTFTIMSVVVDGPSYKAGLLGGDRILKIDGVDINGKTTGENSLITGLRGKKGTVVSLTILRNPDKQWLDFRVERDKIPIHSVDVAYMADKETGYIKLNRFSANTLKEFRKSFEDLKEAGMQNLILDIRGNSGGYLNAAIDLCDEFLKKGQTIVSTRGRHSPELKYTAHGRGKYEEGRLIVMIDEGSASASEIFAGAIQDHDRGVIAGRRSYGKGLVQKPYYLPDGSMMRLTTARYYTPSGRCIQKPFNEGAERYFKEIAHRSLKGEFVHPDSIQFPDSLRFATTAGRLVYGGGGILPDVFIPVDSAMLTSLFKETSKANLFNECALTYLESRRTALRIQYPDASDFVKSFEPDSSFYGELLSLVGNKEIKMTERSIQLSEAALKNQLKATIARDLYGQQAYFRVIEEHDPWVMKVMEMMSSKTIFSDLGEK